MAVDFYPKSATLSNVSNLVILLVQKILHKRFLDSSKISKMKKM
jgi:hypothetical protein